MRKQTIFKPTQYTRAKKANAVLTFKLIPYYGFEYIDGIDSVRNFLKTEILSAKCVLIERPWTMGHSYSLQLTDEKHLE